MSEQAREWLRIAYSDLEAADILRQAGQYPQAAFFFQQSVEKGFKAFLLALGEANEEQVRKDISHDPLRFYLKTAKENKKIAGNLPQSTLKETMIDDINAFENTLKEKQEQGIKAVSAGLEEIDETIQTIAELMDGLKQSLHTRKKAKPIDLIKSQDSFMKILADLGLDGQKAGYQDLFEQIKQNKKLINDLASLKSLHAMLFCFVFCFLSYMKISMITLPHERYSRYPENSYTPLAVYNKTLPFVKRLRQLISLHDDMLAGVELMILSSTSLEKYTERLAKQYA